MDLNIPLTRDDPNASLDDNANANDEKSNPAADKLRSHHHHPADEVGSPITINQSISDPTTELTEEDIFRMKSMSIEQNGWKNGPAASELQSAVSQVDSASNYIADDGEQQSEADEGEVEERQSATDEEGDEHHGEEDEEEEEDQEGADGHNRQGPTGPASLEAMTRQMARRFYVDSKVFLYDGYAFGRNRPVEPVLNRDTVTLLNYPFVPATIPSGIDSDEFRRSFSGAKVYLVGTAHFSKESCRDVVQTVLSTQPDCVMVELCSSRIHILSMDEQALMREAQSLTRQKIMAFIREQGFTKGLMQVLLMSLSFHITQQLGMAPGGEFRAAHAASKMVPGCGLSLGDRPLNVTLQRVLAALSIMQRLKFFFHLVLSLGIEIDQAEVERCKDTDMLEEMLQQMAGQFPQVSRILVDERDQYMTQVLHTLLQKTTMEKLYASKKCNAPFEPVTIVAVVGMGHVAGIRSNWTKHIDAAPLLTVPLPSMKARIFSTALKLTVVGLVGYGAWRVGCFVLRKIH